MWRIAWPKLGSDRDALGLPGPARGHLDELPLRTVVDPQPEAAAGWFGDRTVDRAGVSQAAPGILLASHAEGVQEHAAGLHRSVAAVRAEVAQPGVAVDRRGEDPTVLVGRHLVVDEVICGGDPTV